MDVIDEVRRAYDEETRNLDFRASAPVMVEGIGPYLRAIGHYNNFDPVRVARALKRAGPNATVVIARESSPTLYITTRHVRKVKAAMFDALADQVTSEGAGVVRAWWD